MPIDRFLHSLSQISSPCTKYACQHQRACAEERKACTAFLVFVETGLVFSPLDHFDFLSDPKPIPRRMHSVTPTRENYDRMRSDCSAKSDDVLHEAADEAVFSAVGGMVATSAFSYAASLADLPNLQEEQAD